MQANEFQSLPVDMEYLSQAPDGPQLRLGAVNYGICSGCTREMRRMRAKLVLRVVCCVVRCVRHMRSNVPPDLMGWALVSDNRRAEFNVVVVESALGSLSSNMGGQHLCTWCQTLVREHKARTAVSSLSTPAAHRARSPAAATGVFTGKLLGRFAARNVVRRKAVAGPFAAERRFKHAELHHRLAA